jgi:hypothetical protein
VAVPDPEAVQPIPAMSAAIAAGHTAQIAAATGLLAWLLAQRRRRTGQITIWACAIAYVAVSAGSWVYLNWSRPSETVAAVLVGAAWATLNAAIWSAPNGNRPDHVVHPAPGKTSSRPSLVR